APAVDAGGPAMDVGEPAVDAGQPAADADAGATAAETDSPAADAGAVAADVPEDVAPPVLVVSEADVDAALALVQQEVQVSPSRELVAAALRASEAEFETMQAMAGRLAVDILSRRRIAEGDVEAVRAELRAEAAARQVPPHLQEAVAEAVSLAVVPNLILSPARVERARPEAMRHGQDVISVVAR